MVYFVATPIGNLKEITYRAVETLKSVDVIFCEDTRHSRILLNEYGITAKLLSYHKFNERATLEKVGDFAKNNKSVAIISDAGMPGINDPGNILVNYLIAEGIEYTVLSGATALINAFVLSGYSAPFTFVGFLPEQTCDKDRLLESVTASNTTLIFYCAVHDINDTLAYLCQRLGDRNACVVKEISKIHESAQHIRLSGRVENLLGEYCLVVEGKSPENVLNSLATEQHIEYYVSCGFSKMEAIKQTAKDLGVSKNEIYKTTI